MENRQRVRMVRLGNREGNRVGFKYRGRPTFGSTDAADRFENPFYRGRPHLPEIRPDLSLPWTFPCSGPFRSGSTLKTGTGSRPNDQSPLNAAGKLLEGIQADDLLAADGIQMPKNFNFNGVCHRDDRPIAKSKNSNLGVLAGVNRIIMLFSSVIERVLPPGNDPPQGKLGTLENAGPGGIKIVIDNDRIVCLDP